MTLFFENLRIEIVKILTNLFENKLFILSTYIFTLLLLLISIKIK